MGRREWLLTAGLLMVLVIAVNMAAAIGCSSHRVVPMTATQSSTLVTPFCAWAVADLGGNETDIMLCTSVESSCEWLRKAAADIGYPVLSVSEKCIH